MSLAGARFGDGTLDNIVFIHFFFAEIFLSKYIKIDFLQKKS